MTGDGNGAHGLAAYRLRYAKTGRARTLSHKDLLRTFERALRRLRLPLAFTAGFNPRPRMSLRPAVSLGPAVCAASLELVLTQPFEPAVLCDLFADALPEGLCVGSTTRLDRVKPSPLTATIWRYVRMPAPETDADLPLDIGIEHSENGDVRVRVNALPGQDPPGPRRLAEALWPGMPERDWIDGVTLVDVIFEDGK